MRKTTMQEATGARRHRETGTGKEKPLHTHFLPSFENRPYRSNGFAWQPYLQARSSTLYYGQRSSRRPPTITALIPRPYASCLLTQTMGISGWYASSSSLWQWASSGGLPALEGRQSSPTTIQVARGVERERAGQPSVTN